MSTAEEIESAVSGLAPEELRGFGLGLTNSTPIRGTGNGKNTSRTGKGSTIWPIRQFRTFAKADALSCEALCHCEVLTALA